MDMTMFAKIFGPILVAFGLFCIFYREEAMKTAKNFAGAHGAYWFEAFISMIIGLAILNADWTWSSGWSMFVPLYGWLCFGKGALLLFFPKGTHQVWGNMANLILFGSLRVLFGVVFVCLGYGM